MAEVLSDATSIQLGLLKNLDETDAALLQQARIGRELQQNLMRMRAVPFANLGERMHRVVRQTARETDRKAELEIQVQQLQERVDDLESGIAVAETAVKATSTESHAKVKTVEQERDTARSCQLVSHRRYRPGGHETCGTVLSYVVGTEVGLPWCMRAR